MRRRTGVIGGVAAGVLALGGAGAIAAGRVVASRRRVDISALSEQPKDRVGRVVTEDGLGLYYEELGPVDAELTVVFVHGFCVHLGEFCFQRADLAARFGDRIRLVLYDQRSHGRSEHGPGESDSIDQLGRDLGVVIDALVPRGPLVLVGHSMGGMTVMALADSRPELFDPDTGRVAGVALIATSAGKIAAVTLGLPALLAKFTGPVLPLLLRGARSQVNLVERGRALGSDLAWLITRRLAFGSPDVDPAVLQYLTTMIASTRIDVIADFYGTLMSHDKLSALKRLDGIPTRIVCGDRDLLTPLEHSAAIAAELADAELVVVPDTGHLVLMERPDQVNEAIAALVAGALEVDPPSAGGWWRHR